MKITTIIILFYHGGTISDTQNQEYCPAGIFFCKLYLMTVRNVFLLVHMIVLQ